MRTITRIRRSIRAISPVISVLLMIAIAVVASLVVYAWVMGYIGFQTGHVGKAVQIQSVARDGTAGNLVVYVQNVGQGTVKLDPASSLYANDTNQASTIDNPTLAPGQTATITALNYPVALTDLVKVKVVTGDGTYSQVTQAPQGNGGSSGSTYQVSFAVGAGGGGSTSPSVSMSYDAGASVPILATPDGTHTFSQWTADTGSITFDSATSASTNAHINGAGTITATFALAGVQYSVSFAVGAGGGGSTSPSVSMSYDAGASVPILATPDGTHTFSQWTADTGSITFDSATSASTNAHINGAGTITATFALAGVQYSVSFAVGAGGGGSTSPSVSMSYDAGASVPILATPDGTHTFSQWTADTGSITFDSATSASTNAHINGAGTITATFALAGVQYSVSFAVGAGGGGSTSPSVSMSYDAGASVPILATPDGTHTFSQWTADTGSITFDSATSASTNAHINGAGTITATFALAVQQVIFVSAGSGSGSTNGNPAPGYPTSLQANDLILLQVTVRGDSTPTITVPNGFALLRGPDATGGSSSRVTQWIYYKFSTGSESGTGTVTITGTNYDRAARMYAFRNVALTSFTEGAGYRIGEDDVILAQSVTTTGIKRLAVTFVSVENDISVGSFTGGSGGTWTEPVSEFTFNGDDDICMQLQTATMANAGTIQNGSYDTGSTSYRWVVTAFALIPR